MRDIKSLISDLSDLTKDMATLITNTSKIDTSSIKANLENIIKASSVLVQKVEDDETKMYLGSIVKSSADILETLDKISTSETIQKNVTLLVKDLNNVSNELSEVRKIISEHVAKALKEFMKDLSDTSYSLE